MVKHKKLNLNPNQKLKLKVNSKPRKSRSKKKSFNLGFIFKLMISIVWDFLDFTVFRIPGLGTVSDIVGTLLTMKLWGYRGALAGWEIFEPTDQIDGFVPTMTLIGLSTLYW
ncbi:MAG: hypothetical protein MUO43_12535 [Desulfobacterales bacterium]|nr:hypothetical protein [Desulfobacterales bacterium]